MLRALASRVMRSATSRTWPTEPAAPVSSAACSVWTESITQTSGRSASSVASTASRSVSATTGTSQRGAGEPLGAQLDLRRGLLAGDVERAPAGAREVAERHRGERALADAGRAAEQHERAGHEAPAEHAVELADPGLEPRDPGRLDLGEGDGLDGAGGGRCGAPAAAATGSGGLDLLVERVPLPAAGALPHPLRGRVAAGGADELRTRRHERI